MPPLTAELAGLAATIAGLLVIAVVVDPTLRARRAANRHSRKLSKVRRHAAAGCPICRLTLEGLDRDAELASLEARINALRDDLAGGTR